MQIVMADRSAFWSSLHETYNTVPIILYLPQSNSMPLYILQNNDFWKSLTDRMDYWDKRGYDTWNSNHAVQLKRLKKGKYVYISDSDSLVDETMKVGQCDLTILPEKFLPIHYSIGTQEDSPYKDVFSLK